MIGITFDGVTKVYPGGVRVIDSFDLEVAGGEFLTFVGPSGCGKSTLLNLLAGFEKPTAGIIRIDGEVVNERAPSDRGVAMVFQSYALYPHLDVRSNIAFPLEVARAPRAEIEERVKEVADRLGLSGLLSRRPRELSGGQRQRVALGRALVRRPKLCLFDEPLSNLDAALRGQMRAEIKKLHEELGATFIYVTHDQAEAMTLSDRVVVLNKGRIEQAGAPREVYERPATRFVASFVGTPPINVVAPSVLLGDAAPPSKGWVAAIRPEDVHVAESPDASRRAARVWLVEPMGPETWVTVDMDEARLVGRAASSFGTRPGELAYLSLDVTKIHLFDESGRRAAVEPAEGPA